MNTLPFLSQQNNPKVNRFREKRKKHLGHSQHFKSAPNDFCLIVTIIKYFLIKYMLTETIYFELYILIAG